MKKIGEYTLWDVWNYCVDSKPCRSSCPLHNLCGKGFDDWGAWDLEQEADLYAGEAW